MNVRFENIPMQNPPTHSLVRSIWRAARTDRLRIRKAYLRCLVATFGLFTILLLVRLIWADLPKSAWWILPYLVDVSLFAVVACCLGMLMLQKPRHFTIAQQVRQERGLHYTPWWAYRLDDDLVYKAFFGIIGLSAFVVMLVR